MQLLSVEKDELNKTIVKKKDEVLKQLRESAKKQETKEEKEKSP